MSWHTRSTFRKLQTSVSPQEYLHTMSYVMYQVKIYYSRKSEECLSSYIDAFLLGKCKLA